MRHFGAISFFSDQLIMDRDEASLGVEPYSFEPRYSQDEITARAREAEQHRSSASDNSNSDGEADPPPTGLMANNDWCTCNSCIPLDQPMQCRCCQEVPNCRHFFTDDDIVCITRHEDFGRVCLQKAVLRTALIAQLDTRGHRARLPEELDSEYVTVTFFHEFILNNKNYYHLSVSESIR